MTNWTRTNRFEYVYWSPDLYRWNGSRWTFYWEKPWLRGAANAYNVQPVNGYKWFYANNPNQPAVTLRFTGLPSGYYAVKEYFNWAYNDYTTSGWSRVQGTQSNSCSFR